MDRKPTYEELEKHMKQLENQLKAANMQVSRLQDKARLNEALAVARMGYWEYDLKNDRLYWSDEVFDIFGLDPSDFTPSYDNFMACLHPDDYLMVKTSYLEALKKGQDYEIEHRIIKPNGETAYVVERCKNTYTEAGEAIRSLGTVHDISQRKALELQLSNMNKELEERVKERTRKLQDEIEERQKIEQELLTYRQELELQNQELEEAQERIEESYSKYSDLYDYAPVGYLTLNQKAMIQEVNQTLAEMLGMSKSQLIDKPLTLFIDEQEKGNYYTGINKLLQPGNSGHLELRLRRKDGSAFYALLESVYVEDNNTQHYFRGSIININERKKAEQALAYERDLIRQLIETIPDTIYIKDRESRFTLINPAQAELIGVPIDEAIGKTDFDFFDHAQEAYEDEQKVLETGQAIWNKQEYVKTAHSGYRWMLASKVPLRNKEGSITGIVGTSHDITELLRIQEVIKEQNDFLKNITESLSHPFYVIDANSYRIVQANSASGLTEDDISKIRCHELAHHSAKPCDEADLLCPIKAVKRDKKAVTVEHLHYTKDTNSKRHLEIHAHPVLDKNGEVSLVIQYALDITERKCAESALRKSEKDLRDLNATKDKFFSLIAHDLKNPFGTLMGISELLMTNYDDLERKSIYDLLKALNGTARNAYKLLENLLLWSRSQTGRMAFRPRQIELLEVCEEVIALLKNQAGNKKITLNNHVKAGLTVFADKNMLATIIRNIVSNAIKFTRPNGSVDIEAQQSDSHTIINISDTGIGIPQKQIDKLFDIDVQYSRTGTADEAGTGLGLVLCKEFIEKNKGQITVKSQEGEGSIFTIDLPIYPPKKHINRSQ